MGNLPWPLCLAASSFGHFIPLTASQTGQGLLSHSLRPSCSYSGSFSCGRSVRGAGTGAARALRTGGLPASAFVFVFVFVFQ